MHARNDVVFGKIMAKLEILLQQYNCSPSSSHGAANSPNDIPTSEQLNVNLPIQDEIRSSAKQIEVPDDEEELEFEPQQLVRGGYSDEQPIVV
ncbi:hypothetical protein A2U01_0072375, partial [Trifolium medium]|nr:hypothetical protein [Trifolium medium]